MVNRRQFLGSLGLPLMWTPLGLLGRGRTAGWEELHSFFSSLSPEEAAAEEVLWFQVRQAFTVDRSILNLNNGGVSPSPGPVQEAMRRFLEYSNTAPAYSMWKVLEPQRETVRVRLARAFGCDPEEMALTRNASESLQICQFGFDLKPGDEVLTTNQDYPRMITTFQQRERREGIVLRQFSIPTPAEDVGEIVSRFEQHLTPRTRLILMCHMINLTGQILPVKEVVQMARSRGIPVIVDGAHSFAHFDFRWQDLDCDYFASSLHKWLFAPHGTGMLFVRREKISQLWPLMAAPKALEGDIRKFEEIGTHPAANYLAIADALAFHEGIGARSKEARMRYLRDYWVARLKEHPRVRLHTSLKPQFSCGIATVQLEGIDSEALAQHLWEKKRILVTPIKHAEFEGIRVSPSVYTSLPELDLFCDALEEVLKGGL